MSLAQLKKAIPMGSYKRNRAPKRASVKGPILPRAGEELKYVDTVLQSSTQLYDTTGLATPLNLIAVGDDNTTRDGRQVMIKSVQVKGIIDPIDGIVAATLCRTMLVWDNANNSASTSSAALIAAVLTSANSGAFPLVDNANRFTILWDSYFSMPVLDNQATVALSGGQTTKTVDYYRRINQVSQYSGTTAAIGSIQNGALWLITIGDTAAGNGAVFNGQVRVRFTDQ